MLNQAGGRGEKHIGRHRGNNNCVQIGRGHAALHQSPLGGLGREVAGGDSCIYDMALANPGAIDNPIVGGFYHLFQIIVGQQAGRNEGAQGSNLGARELGHSMSSPDPR